MRSRTRRRLGMVLTAVAAASLAAVSLHAGEDRPSSPSMDQGPPCAMRACGGAMGVAKPHHGGKHLDGVCPKDGACKTGCEYLGRTLDDLDAAIAGATGAVKAGETDDALAALERAKTLIATTRAKLKTPCKAACPKRAADDGRPVNARCPMLGSRIDPDKVPDHLKRRFEGKTIGFCCGGCPQAWDKLTDEERREKLEAAMDAPAQP